MSILYTKVKLYLEDNSKTWDNEKIELANYTDGNGDFIKKWTYDISEPTADQLASYETAANGVEAKNVIITTRKKAYGSWDKQLEEIYDNGIDSWKTRIEKVKLDNPKE